jgi:competence ComEA-like helix-hairpin-helix protein
MNPITSFPRLEVPTTGDLQSRQPGTAPPEAPPSVLSARLSQAARSVWVLPALKLLGICSVLTCIAWLGERAKDETTYGPPLVTALPPPRVEVASQAAERTSPPADRPVTSPPPCVPAGELVRVAPASSALLPDGRLVLNEASADELDRLPGIGKKRAEDIVALRAKLGRFKKVTDLLRVRGIGPRSLEGLKERLVLDRPPPPASPGGESAPRVIPVVAVPAAE